jgi:hypothetical protein
MRMPELHDLLERRASRHQPPRDLFDRVLDRRRRRDRNRRVGTAVVAVAVAAAAIGGVARAFLSGPGTRPASEPRSPFLGVWVSTTDSDGGTQTMTVHASREAGVEILVHDDIATVCSGTPSTMTGTGAFDPNGALVIPSPAYTCNDGSDPEALSGPPLEERLANLTFVLNADSESLTDDLGGVWLREGSERSTQSTQSGGMWPQSSLEEVREAQELADAGDPRYTWQLDPKLAAGDGGPYEAEIFARFLREELGWQEFRGEPVLKEGYLNGSYDGVAFIRCAPGRTNPLYPNDPEGRGCAPTIDELRYETVAIDVKQLDREGRTGIWVVTGWEMLPPSDAPITDLFPSDVYGMQQVVPPTDAEVAGLLEAFLQARIAGEGALKYLQHPDGEPADHIPRLYATSSGAPYERFEFNLSNERSVPSWPTGEQIVKVRLFAEGGNTVVEQPFLIYRAGDGPLGLEYFGQ